MVITGNLDWIDQNHATRTDIAHGLMTVDIRRIEGVTAKLETIELVAYTFLTK